MALAFDTTGSGVTTANASSLTTSLTIVGAGSANVAVIAVAAANTTTARTVSSITYAGSSTGIAQVTGAAGSRTGIAGAETRSSDLWSITSPTTGANNLVTTMSGTAEGIAHGFVSYSGGDTTTPVDGGANTSGTTGSPSLAVTSASGEEVVGIISAFGNPATDVTAGDTERWERTDFHALDFIGNCETVTGAAPTATLDWTVTTPTGWCISACSVNAGGGGGTITGRLLEGKLLRGGILSGRLAR